MNFRTETHRRTMPDHHRRTTLDLALAYVLLVGVTLLVWNASGGGLIEDWYAEYGGGSTGSGAWRGADGSAFQWFALLLGTWIYPLAPMVAVGFGVRALRAEGIYPRLRAVASAVASTGILVSFLCLGVFHAVSSL